MIKSQFYTVYRSLFLSKILVKIELNEDEKMKVNFE